MSFEPYREHYLKLLDDVRQAGMWKLERTIVTAQHPRLALEEEPSAPARPALNLCANNYLGLADHPEIIAAACRAMKERGFGMASVRFICGKQDLHERLE